LLRATRLRLAEGKQRFADEDFAGATRLFQEALRYRPDHVEALAWLSRTFLANGDAQSALLVARQAVAVSGGTDQEALDALAAALAVVEGR
jgi:Flp pilus assembly protein TadD